MPFFDREYPKNLIDKCCKLSAILNILSFCFGIAYFVIPVHSIMLDIFGVILLVSWFLNISIIFIVDKYLNKSSLRGKKINRFLYYYLVFFIVGLILMVLSVAVSNFLLIGENSFIISMVVVADTLAGLLGIAILGVYLAMIIYINLENSEVFNFE